MNALQPDFGFLSVKYLLQFPSSWTECDAFAQGWKLHLMLSNISAMGQKSVTSIQQRASLNICSPSNKVNTPRHLLFSSLRLIIHKACVLIYWMDGWRQVSNSKGQIGTEVLYQEREEKEKEHLYKRSQNRISSFKT